MIRTPITRALVAGAVLAVVAACSSSTSPSSDARLRAVQASPDAPDVDVYIDNVKDVTSLVYGNASDYLTVGAGSRHITMTPTGQTTPVLIDLPATLAGGTSYTVMAVNDLASISPLLLTDDMSDPPSGKGKVRLVNASPSAGAVDIYVTTPGTDIAGMSPTVSALGFTHESDYLQLDAGALEVIVTAVGSKTPLIDRPASLDAGQIRTVVILDNTGGGAPYQVTGLADKN